MVVPFPACIARPDTGAGRHLLVQHLTAVAVACGEPSGDSDRRLGFLAGLLHDAGKCHVAWQEYIRPGSRRKRGPPHAPLGTALLLFAGEKLIPRWMPERRARRAAQDQLLDWARAVLGHHGKVPDLNASLLPWQSTGPALTVHEMLAGCDLESVFAWLPRFFPDFQATRDEFRLWLQDYGDRWCKLVLTERPRTVARAGQDDHPQQAMQYPERVAQLICADRLDAGRFQDDPLTPERAEAALQQLQAYCADAARQARQAGADERLIGLRASLQVQAAQQYALQPAAVFYSLLLPTGYGKTVSALRTGLQSCAAGRCRRILYVAPYLSILSQAAGEIAAATGLEVFEHHHLSRMQRFAPGRNVTAGESAANSAPPADDQDVDVMDSWQAPLIATTFNQLFLALFPRRAQHALRRAGLQGAFVIVDEPQIIDASFWNLFLQGLEVVAAQAGCQVLFCTATLPPTHTVLPHTPVRLAAAVPPMNRFTILCQKDRLDRAGLTQMAVRQLTDAPSLAVVLNTVRDAVTVFRALRDELPDSVRSHCLTAMMLAGHKQDTIRRIRQQLAAQAQGNGAPRVAVVCTQILEAGVDLSFRSVLRATSILPSIVQVAGRANRHNEGAPAIVRVFPFAADGEHELRRFVYSDRTARAQTDRLLNQHPALEEIQVPHVLDQYFQQSWTENSHAACLRRFTDAALGKWSELANVEPFGASIPAEEIFVPSLDIPLDEPARRLVDHFAPGGPLELLEQYLDPDLRRNRDFRERKLLNMALRQFLVPARRSVAEQIARPLNDWLWLLADVRHYRSDTGLAHWLEEPDEIEGTTLLI